MMKQVWPLFISCGFLLLLSCDTVEKKPRADEREAIIKKIEREIEGMEHYNSQLKKRNSNLVTKISRLEDLAPKNIELKEYISRLEDKFYRVQSGYSRLESELYKVKKDYSRLEDKFYRVQNGYSNEGDKSDEAENVYLNENFNQFVSKFSNDSTFQLSRIKFPLDYVTSKRLPDGSLDYYGDLDTIKTAVSEWRHRDLRIFNKVSHGRRVYDNFDMRLQPTNERVIRIFVFQTGISTTYFLKAFHGKWFLVKVRDLNL